MALVKYLDWEVRTTGHDLNCSGFNPQRDPTNGVDYTQQDAAEITSLNWKVDSTNNTWIRSTELTNWVNGGKVLASLKGNHIHVAGLPIGGTVLFSWAASTGKPGAYYLQASGGGNPNWPTRPTRFWINKTFTLENTSLPSGSNTWAWGDWDSLGYSTIYVRLGAESDVSPATKAQDDIIADGKNWTRGAYEIINVGTDANGPYLVLDRSPGAVGITNGYGRIGGAMASPGGVSSICPVSYCCWVKTGTYIVPNHGSSPTGLPGAWHLASISNGSAWVIGYDTERKTEPAVYPVVDIAQGSATENANNYGSFVWIKIVNSGFGYRYFGNYPKLWHCEVDSEFGFVGLTRANCYSSWIRRGDLNKGSKYYCFLDSCTGYAGERLAFCVVRYSSFPIGGEYQGENYNVCVYNQATGLNAYSYSSAREFTTYRKCVVVNAQNLQRNWDLHVIAEDIYYHAVTNIGTGNARIFGNGIIQLPGNPFRDPDNGDFRLADNEAGRMLKQAGFGIPGPQGAPEMKFDVGAVQNSFYDIASGDGGAPIPLPMLFGV